MASFPNSQTSSIDRSFHKNIKKKYFSKIPPTSPTTRKIFIKVTISQNLEVSKTNKKNCDEIFVRNPKGKRFVVVML